MDTYKKYEKVSRIMLEYVFYLFSQYLAEGRDTEYETFVTFSREKFEIDPAVTYEVLPRKFSMDHSYLRGGRLRVASELVRAKLMYALRQECGLNPEAVREYHKRVDMMNYYVYLSDFEERPERHRARGRGEYAEVYEKRGDRGLPEGKKEIQAGGRGAVHLVLFRPGSRRLSLVGPAGGQRRARRGGVRGVATLRRQPNQGAGEGEYTLMPWESETSYRLSGSGERYVSWIHTPKGDVYQAMLPYPL
jgi:hypothetical protein